MSTIVTQPQTQQQRIFSKSSFWRRQVTDKQQRINDHIAKLEQEMPANANGVHVVLNLPSGKIKKVMTWDEHKRECWNDYVEFVGWKVGGIIGGKPSKERQFCEQVINNILEDDALFDSMTAEEMDHEMFAWEQLPYTPFVPRETLQEVM